MKILFPVVEYHSLTNYGDLGITIENLVTKLTRSGQEISICLPFYPDIFTSKYDITPLVSVGDLPGLINILGYTVSFWKMKFDNIQIYLVKNSEFFTYRKNIYGYEDDNYRFVFYSLAVIELLRYLEEKPDIIHLHDWHTALIPLLLKLNRIDIRTVLTIHNIHYQGVSEIDILNFANIGYQFFLAGGLEFYNRINLLKSGICMCDVLTTNSKNYLHEIQESFEISKGLSGVLKQTLSKASGIALGVEESYNPKKDKIIKTNFSNQDLSGKLECKIALQKELDLPVHTEIPIMVIPSVNISDSEIWLLNSIIPYLIRMEIQIIILGNKLVDFEKNIREVAFRLNCTVISVEDSEENKRKVFAGADIFLDTSLDSINDNLIKISLKYGVIPIVFKESPDLEIEADKFRLFNFTTEDLINTIKYTINKYYHLDKWNEKVKRVMSYDFSWNQTIRSYLKLYKQVKEEM